MGDRVTITGDLGGVDATALVRELFPEPGVYYVEPLLKAASPLPSVDEWEGWFMRRLHQESRRYFAQSERAIWQVLDDVLRRRGVAAPSDLDYWELQKTFFDLTTASTARMVGLPVPQDLTQRLRTMGWSETQALDFPALAYRFGKIYQTLLEQPAAPWERLIDQARSFPLSRVEERAIDITRQRAGNNLRPIFDEAGRVWTAEREIEPLRDILERGQRERRGAGKMASELGNSQRAQGVFREADRVIITELAEAQGNATWDDQAAKWKDDQLLWRPTSPTACKDCLRLLKMPDGMPRLYTMAEVEAADALGWNTGPRESWHVRKGGLHPRCRCGPWRRWLESMRSILEKTATEHAARIARLKVFREAA